MRFLLSIIDGCIGSAMVLMSDGSSKLCEYILGNGRIGSSRLTAGSGIGSVSSFVGISPLPVV